MKRQTDSDYSERSYENLARGKVSYSQGFACIWAIILSIGAAVIFWNPGVGCACFVVYLWANGVFLWKVFGPNNSGGLYQCAKSLDNLIAAERRDTRTKERSRVSRPSDPSAN